MQRGEGRRSPAARGSPKPPSRRGKPRSNEPSVQPESHRFPTSLNTNDKKKLPFDTLVARICFAASLASVCVEIGNKFLFPGAGSGIALTTVLNVIILCLTGYAVVREWYHED